MSLLRSQLHTTESTLTSLSRKCLHRNYARPQMLNQYRSRIQANRPEPTSRPQNHSASAVIRKGTITTVGGADQQSVSTADDWETALTLTGRRTATTGPMGAPGIQWHHAMTGSSFWGTHLPRQRAASAYAGSRALSPLPHPVPPHSTSLACVHFLIKVSCNSICNINHI